MNKLPGDYIAGFVDGEGCFALKFRRDVRHKRKGVPVYFYWDIEFAIVLRDDDREILEKIQLTLNCGKISHSISQKQIRYAVNNIDDLIAKIVPFFEQHCLRAKKRFDFLLWKKALYILAKNQQRNIDRVRKRGFQKIAWTKTDLEKLKNVHESMKWYKSKGSEWKWIHNV